MYLAYSKLFSHENHFRYKDGFTIAFKVQMTFIIYLDISVIHFLFLEVFNPLNLNVTIMLESLLLVQRSYMIYCPIFSIEIY